MSRLYRHPDGEGVIFFDAENCRLRLENPAVGQSAYALIGADGLVELGLALVALGFELRNTPEVTHE